MTKCSNCGRGFHEGFAYCPSCGTKVTTAQDVSNSRRIAVEEKMRDLRHGEIAWAVVGGMAMCATAFCWVLYFPLAVVAFILSIVFFALSIRYHRQRHHLITKLERGE